MDSLRINYFTDHSDIISDSSLPPKRIRRDHLYDDVMDTYKDNALEILKEKDFRIEYEGERAIDTGGVSRDMFSSFWEEVYVKHFDGETLLVPAMHPNTQITTFPISGTIISHGFLASGFLPVRIAFPVIAAVLHGLDIVDMISDAILLESFVDYLSTHESSILRDAIIVSEKDSVFSPVMQSQLIDMLSRLGCTEVPNPVNIKRLVLNIARHQLLNKPLGLLFTFRSGVPIPHQSFWKQLSMEKLFQLYKALNASSSSVLKMVEEPEDMNSAQSRVFGYLTTFIGNAKQKQLFLRFVTGSSVLITKPINISFNNLSGFARRPISHTCDCRLELSIAYTTFPEFESEFAQILDHEMSWLMDAL